MAPTVLTQRIALTANVAKTIFPPNAHYAVEIGNATPDDLRVYTDPNDDATYFVVAAGYAKTIAFQRNRFGSYEVAFYLKALTTGTAVLIWL